MPKSGLLKIILGLLLILLALGCGEPELDALDPSAGPPRTLVDIIGDDIVSDILWDADMAVPDTLPPGRFFGGGPFSVPVGATMGDHQVALSRNDERSTTTLPFTVTGTVVPFPNPEITHLSTALLDAIPSTSSAPDSMLFWLAAQGLNIDVGARIVIDGIEYPSIFWRGLRYNSASYNISTLNRPIFHYGMVLTGVRAEVGSTLNIEVRNLDNTLSNSLTFIVPDSTQWDSDGDGLLDTWEEEGYDADGDGVIDCDLPAMGAHPNIYDVFVEVDFMDGETAADPDKVPHINTWDIVDQTFRNSPLINIYQGLQGIQLHVDRGQSTFTDLRGTVHNIPAAEQKGGEILPFDDYIRMDADTVSFAQPGETTVNFYDLKATNFDGNARRDIFHYAIFANSHGHGLNNSGRGEIWGSDFFVTISDNRLSSPTSSAGTFLHELGHNFGLDHGGDDSFSNKPNHVSVMSYFSADTTFGNSYQVGGVDINCDTFPDGVYDYSRGMLNALNETALNENNGTCNNVFIDWNGNGVPDSLTTFNIDRTITTLLTDHNNWGADFKFNFRLASSFND